MFSIHRPEDDNWYSDKTRVVDAERDVALEFRNGTGRDLGGAFVLTHGDMQIPFHTRQSGSLTDEESGKPYFTVEIMTFGTSIYLKGDRNVPDYVFESVEESRKWRRIAAEALLIFGLHYNGMKYDPEYSRVLLDGQLLTRRDFGYAN
jgi:hypothetical protein